MAADSGGFTLIEVLVVVALMGIIMVPITMVSVAMIRANTNTSNRLTSTADSQRLAKAWLTDVQSVNPRGINQAQCMPPQSSTLLNRSITQLVTFTFSVRDAASSTTTLASDPLYDRHATWVVRGGGRDAEIVRFVCEGETFLGASILATRLGLGGTFTNQVRGPTGSAAQLRFLDTGEDNFCPPTRYKEDPNNPASPDLPVGEFCTLVVDAPALRYELTAARRVPDTSGLFTPRRPNPPVITATYGRNQYGLVTWDPVVPATGQPSVDNYAVYAYTAPDCSGTPAWSRTDVPASATSQRIEPLTNFVQYCIQVHAHNSIGWSAPSAERFLTPQPGPPEAPTWLWDPPRSGPWCPGNELVLRGRWQPGNNGGSNVTHWTVNVYRMDGFLAIPPVVVPHNGPQGDAHQVDICLSAGLVLDTGYRLQVVGSSATGPGDPSVLTQPVALYNPQVFVNAANGNDSYDCVNPSVYGAQNEGPCRTLNGALARAASNSLSRVVVAEGTYSQATVSVPGVTIQGGFASDFTASRRTTPSSGVETVITGAVKTVTGHDAFVGVHIVGVGATGATLRDLTVRPGAADPAKTSSGITIDSSSATLDTVIVEGGDGSSGSVGIRVRNGSIGAPIASVVNVIDSGMSSGTTTVAGASLYGLRVQGNPSGTVTVNLTNSYVESLTPPPGVTGSSGVVGATGGGGAAGAAGAARAVGGTGGGSNGGAGGTAGGACGSGTIGGLGRSDNPGNGTVNAGGPGSAGGGGGTAGQASQSGVAFDIAPAAGAVGGTGGAGGGGGGGGGACGVGGTGGTGGTGGAGGAGGGGGGGSFGIWATSDTTVNLTASVVVRTASGGKGGTGGVGGRGGAGTAGSSANCAVNPSGGPGAGGGGGGGAGGGGGGAGGPSYAVYKAGAAVVNENGADLQFGSGGAGGDGGAGGAPGPGGGPGIYCGGGDGFYGGSVSAGLPGSSGASGLAGVRNK